MKKWKQFLKEAIVEQANPNKPKAIFMAGGPGSGKPHF